MVRIQPSRPRIPENPKWENLNNSVGAQYFWIDRIFDWKSDPSTYVYQMFHTSRPGALDTSLVSSDNINNPRTMNAIYNLGPRIEQGRARGKETLGPGSDNNKQLNDYRAAGRSAGAVFHSAKTVYTRVSLKDGSDSVGALGALNRVYLNIGLFSEEWLRISTRSLAARTSRRSRSLSRVRIRATGKRLKRRPSTWPASF